MWKSFSEIHSNNEENHLDRTRQKKVPIHRFTRRYCASSWCNGNTIQMWHHLWGSMSPVPQKGRACNTDKCVKCLGFLHTQAVFKVLSICSHCDHFKIRVLHSSLAFFLKKEDNWLSLTSLVLQLLRSLWGRIPENLLKKEVNYIYKIHSKNFARKFLSGILEIFLRSSQIFSYKHLKKTS